MSFGDAEQRPAVIKGETLPNEICDVCGSDLVSWRKCKLVCGNCGTILKSCADL